MRGDEIRGDIGSGFASPIVSFSISISTQLDTLNTLNLVPFGPDRVVVIGEANRFGRYGSPLTCLGKPFNDSRCEYSPNSRAVEFNRKMGKELAEVGISFIDPTT